MLRESQFSWFHMYKQFMFRCSNFIYLFFLIGNKLISAFAASTRSSEFGLRSGQSPIQLITNHHLVLCSKEGSNDLAPQHCSITCFPFHSRVYFIFLQTTMHYSSCLPFPLFLIKKWCLPSMNSFSRPSMRNLYSIQFIFLLIIIPAKLSGS